MYGQGLDVFAHLVPRSVDTITTLMQMQGQLDHTGRAGAGGASVLPACNLHKMENGGMNGLALQLPEDIPVMYLDTLTNNLFEGVSLVRCTDPKTVARRLECAPCELLDKLQTFNAEERAARPVQPSLDQVLPLAGASSDFWWNRQAALSKFPDNATISLVGGGNAAEFRYYDMFSCAPDGTTAAEGDENARDGAVWHAALSGYVALVEQQSGAGRGFFLACRSALPAFASALVDSYRSDVGMHMTAGEFVESKEMWFLRRANDRNRRRLLARAAAALEIEIPTSADALAHTSADAPRLASCCLETLLEDVQLADARDVLASECTPLGSEPRTAKRVRVVRHFLGCVDARAARGPVLMDMGRQQGLAAFLPLDSEALTVEQMRTRTFPLLASDELTLLPVVNVRDKSRADSEFAQHIVRELPTLEPEDVLYAAEHTQTALPARVQALCEGRVSMHARRYPEQLGTVLYPSQPTVMLPENDHASTFEQDLPAVRVSRKDNKRFLKSLADVMIQDMSVSVEAQTAPEARAAAAGSDTVVCLELDAAMLETVQYLTAPQHPPVPVFRLAPCRAAHACARLR